MKYKIVSLVVLLLVTCFIYPKDSYSGVVCSRQNYDKALEIMTKVDDWSKRYDTQVSYVHMQIFDEKGSIRTRYFTSIKKKNDELVKNLIKFYKPSNIKGTSLLTHSYHDDQDDLQWIYLPALRSIRQLNSNDKNKSFMGSDFTNSDVAGRNINRDNHCFIKENSKYYVVDSFPKDKEDIYSRLQLVISKEVMVPVKVTFYSKKDRGEEEVLKILQNKKIDKFGNLFVVTRSQMDNKKLGSRTLIEVLDVDLSKKINDRDLGIKGLR